MSFLKTLKQFWGTVVLKIYEFDYNIVDMRNATYNVSRL